MTQIRCKLLLIIITIFITTKANAQSIEQYQELKDKSFSNFEQYKMKEAAEYGEKALDILKKNGAEFEFNYFIMLYTVLHAQFFSFEFDKVTSYGHKIYKYKSVVPEEYINYYYSALYVYAFSCKKAQNKNESNKAFKELSKYNVDVELKLELARSFGRIGLLKYKKGDMTSAINYYKMSVEIFDSERQNKNGDYPKLLNALADSYINAGKINEAIDYNIKAIDIYKNQDIIDINGYIKAANDICVCFVGLSQFEKANKLFEELGTFLNNNVSKNSREYAIYLANYSNLLLKESKVEESINKIKESIEIQKEIGCDKRDIIMANILLVNCHLHLSQYEEAELLVKENIEIAKKEFGKINELYAVLSKLQAAIYNYKGEYLKALNIIENEAVPAITMAGENKALLRDILFVELDIYSNIGLYEKNNQIINDLLNDYRNEFGTNTTDYAFMLKLAAESYYLIKDYKNAISCSEQSANIYKEILGEYSKEYLYSLMDLSRYYLNQGNNKQSQILLEEVIKIEDKLESDNINDKSKIYLLIANSFFEIRLYDKAIEYYQKGADIDMKLHGKNNINYLNNLIFIAYCYSQIGNRDKSTNTFVEYFDGLSDIIKDNLLGLKQTYKKEYWNKYAYAYKILYPKYCIDNIDNEKAISKFYDISLLSKGILLNTTIMQNHMHNSPEKQNTNISKWQDVQNCLDDSTVAIEFQEIIYDENNTQYCALVLRKDYNSPKLIPLFSLNEYHNIPKDSLYNSLKIYNLIWKPLETEIKNVKKIYFAPDGIIHNIAIESAYLGENSYMSDQYNIYRLSSTREIVKKQSDKKNNTVVLYGGLKYDTSPEELIQANIENSSKQSSTDYFAERPFVEERGSINYLEGSKKEVLDIEKIIQTTNKTTLYTDQYGTEESFKNLTGSEINILHISTHGYFYSENNVYSQLYQNTLDENASLEDKALTRSGLYLAGANNFLTNKSIPRNMEDGLLSAYEISKLNLKNLDLVVLSACQTGLGEIMGDGVFGLQRGFKIAGAKSIIMSLWKVNDLSTQMMMTEFYRNYCLGLSKHHALLNAQKYIREFSDEDGNKIFKDPYYWAGFILLDAII